LIVRIGRERVDRREVDEPAHARLLAGGDDVARAVDVDGVHERVVAGDDGDARGEMEDALAAVEGALERRDIGEIGVEELAADAFEPALVAVVHERAHAMPTVDERTYEVGADVAGGAGDRD